MQITNPFSRSLTVVATGQKVGPGESVEVDEETGRSLLEQGWRTTKAKTRPGSAGEPPTEG